MMRNRFIAVDQGNSFFKLTLLHGNEVLEMERIPSSDAEDFFTALERMKPDCGAFCSVGRIDPRVVESLRIALNGRLLILSRQTPLPIEIVYAGKPTLGLDRIALAAGASAEFPGECLLVADAGTAVTLDVVDNTGAFRGGRISAGLQLRFEALHRATSALPLVSDFGELPIIGDTTETCIRSGVVRGMAAELSGTFHEYNELFGCSRLVATGGDAPAILKCIPNSIPACHLPNLMAKGLLYIYNYNEKIN